MRRELIRTEVMAIVHGLSEYRICNSIKSNLKIKHEIIARDKGKTSIQINGIMNILGDKRFRSFKEFINCFKDIRHDNKGKLLNFRLFIIMDVDDCSEDIKKRFINKEIFARHWLCDYITPIFNEPNLERTMSVAGIQVQKKKDYILIFPTNHGDLDIEKAKQFYDQLASCKCSNMDEYVRYCLSIKGIS